MIRERDHVVEQQLNEKIGGAHILIAQPATFAYIRINLKQVQTRADYRGSLVFHRFTSKSVQASMKLMQNTDARCITLRKRDTGGDAIPAAIFLVAIANTHMHAYIKCIANNYAVQINGYETVHTNTNVSPKHSKLLLAIAHFNAFAMRFSYPSLFAQNGDQMNG